ncbi:hypothetical protein Asppvi_003445 [Aspergillus pseudoviridinutans]|uniref:Uncharacterized protein n=1 Tax=Aspergillus pseudoviridinutans TaxID=1517512 RepID=A0A9P3B8E2_9EURO|nr:uncharacterized protein Asppvi_003445 [Aspergillus pseudoviridinutans]GIJ84598.1 hypothetical protein Asppvi_003445 [Aspergillus pseudoviridinutans]
MSPETREHAYVEWYYVKLISKGTLPDRTDMKLPNNSPTNIHLESPYGHIWFEWPFNMAKTMNWERCLRA